MWNILASYVTFFSFFFFLVVNKISRLTSTKLFNPPAPASSGLTFVKTVKGEVMVHHWTDDGMSGGGAGGGPGNKLEQ